VELERNIDLRWWQERESAAEEACGCTEILTR
jgi:hypothetical protein